MPSGLTVGWVTSDAEVFRGVFDDCFEVMRRYVARRCRPDQVDDVVAEVFTIAWRRRELLPDPALPWLLVTARRVLANSYRAEARRGLLAARLQLVQLPAVPASIPEQCLDAELALALAKLQARDREVLLLSVWDGLSGAEIAEVTGLSVNAVHLRLSRARRRLAALLASETRRDETRSDKTPGGAPAAAPGENPEEVPADLTGSAPARHVRSGE